MALLGYVDRPSAAPGDILRFMVSNGEAATAGVRVLRVQCGLAEPFGPGKKIHPIDDREWTCDVDQQPLLPGSCAEIPAADALPELTIATWVSPTLFHGEERNPHASWTYDLDPVGSVGVSGAQTLVALSGACALEIGEEGDARLRIRGSAVATGERLPRGTWTLVVGRVAADGRLAVSQHSIGPWTRASAAAAAAAGEHPALDVTGVVLGAGLSGRLDSPTIWRRSLTDADVDEVVRAASPRDVAADDIWSAWDFARRIASDEVEDVSAAQRHGRLVNRPTRAVTGFNWQAGTEDYRLSPSTYGAIHFHPDDVGDLDWAPSFTWHVPEDAPSGVYAAEVAVGDEREMLWFVVRPDRQRRAPIVVVLPTLTYLAYANTQLPYPDVEVRPEGFERHEDPRRAIVDTTPGIGRSLYDIHSDGSGVCYASLLRPMPDNRPDFVTDFLGGGRHLAADLYLIDWLTERGYEFDVVTDHDLHRDGLALIDDYAVLITGSHPEYTTGAMLDALLAYGERGGNLMYLGGQRLLLG
jgi:N,N-dimethylformamidase